MTRICCLRFTDLKEYTDKGLFLNVLILSQTFGHTTLIASTFYQPNSPKNKKFTQHTFYESYIAHDNNQSSLTLPSFCLSSLNVIPQTSHHRASCTLPVRLFRTKSTKH